MADSIPLRSAEHPSGEATVQGSNQIVGRRRRWALAAVLLTMFFSSMNQTTVSTAMPVIIGELQGFSLYAWVFTAYMMASAVTVPLYGKLSDIYGRKPFYALGLVLFMIGSAASGLVQSMPQLIAARGFQGIGAGAMLSMPLATVGDIFNPRERGRWVGVVAAIYAVASGIGPTLGGWITDQWGWRWVFYINLPLALVALVAVWYALPTVRTPGRASVDWLGGLLLVAGLLPLLLAFTRLGEATQEPALTGALIGASVLGLALFVAVERRAASPIISPLLFRDRVFVGTAVVAFLVSVAMFGGIMFLPLYLQGVLGLSARAAGQTMTPMMLSLIAGSVLGGQLLSRTGRYRLQAIASVLAMGAGLALLAGLGPDSSRGAFVRYSTLFGVGTGSILPLLNVAVQNAFPYRMMGMVSATQQFVRSLGGVVAAPLLGAALASTFAADFARRLPAEVTEALAGLPATQRAELLDPQGLINAQTQGAIRDLFDTLGSEGPLLHQQFLSALHLSLSLGVSRLLLLALGATVLALGATLFLPEVPLKQDEFYDE